MRLYPSPASAVLDLEGRPRGKATSLSCSLRWQGRWHIPRQGTQCRSHEINMNSAAQAHEWRDKSVTLSPHRSFIHLTESAATLTVRRWWHCEVSCHLFCSVCVCVYVCVCMRPLARRKAKYSMFLKWHSEWSTVLKQNGLFIVRAVGFILCFQSVALLYSPCTKALIKVIVGAGGIASGWGRGFFSFFLFFCLQSLLFLPFQPLCKVFQSGRL